MVSKLKPFRENDRDDARAMADRGLLNPKRLEERFRLAVDAFSMDARAEDLPKVVKNLHIVQRDYLLYT